MVNFSPAQQHASAIALDFVQHPQNHPSELLIWAVTGAGKTETIFAALSDVLQIGKNVLIATPRKDVVIELTPRLQLAFPEYRLVSLHGDSHQKGEISNFVIATTHQAINFYRYFDLVVVDEVDAYPYHNNPMLQRAVSLARTEAGQLIYLTATPSNELISRTKTGKAKQIMIPARHHGYPLVEPTIIIDSQLSKAIRQQQLPRVIIQFIHHLRESQRQGFLFIPKIDWIDPLVELIHKLTTNLTVGNDQMPRESGKQVDLWVAGTYANDPRRKEKIEAFRRGEIRLLVTTTILERGVTIPLTDCLVCWADAPIFDDSSLVQMAGRVGRSTNDPGGKVIYVGESRSAAMVKAIRQIKRMNRLARQNGYLRGSDVSRNEPSILSKLGKLFSRKTNSD